MKLLNVSHVSVVHGEKRIVDDVSFSLLEGERLMIAGLNGAGKTTIIRAITQGCAYRGTVRFLEEDVAAMSATARARAFGVLAQNHETGYRFLVDEVVRLGRYAYRKGLFTGGGDPEGEEKVTEALALCGMTELRYAPVQTLSGGEMQRMFLAQLFAQDPAILILDEPMNHLDLKYRKQMSDITGQWAKRQGRAVISVMHDIGYAARFATHALFLKEGRAVAYGNMQDVFTDEILNETFEMDVAGYYEGVGKGW